MQKSSWVENFQMNVSGVTISADVEVIEKVDYNRHELWFNFYPTFSDGQNSLTMGRFHFFSEENKTLENHVLDNIVQALYKTYDFVDLYPTLEDYIGERLMDDFSNYTEYIHNYAQSIQLKKIVTRDWIDSIAIAQKLEE